MKDYNLGTLEPGAEVTVNAPGNYIRVISALDDIKVKATSTIEAGAPAFDTSIKPNGARITRAIYTQWRVKNTSSIAQPLILLIGIGKAEENEITLAGTVATESPGNYLDIADVSIGAAANTIIVAANVNRNEVVITADAGNASLARIGSSSAGAARGTILKPDSTLILTTTAAVYAYSANAATFNISYTEY